MPDVTRESRPPMPWLARRLWSPPRPRRLEPACDVAIVGGGIMGVAVTYWLALAGQRVTLFESRRIGSGASGRNAGLLLAGASEIENPALLCSVLAREQIDARYEQTGHLALAASEAMLARMHDELTGRPATAPPLRVLSHAECEHLLETRIARGLFGGRWYAGGAQLDPGRLLAGLAAAATRHGAHLAEMTMVRSIRAMGRTDRVEVDTSRGRVRARHVVVAASAATGRLLPELAHAFAPLRGQMLATRPTRRLFRPAMAIDWGAMYWRQTVDGVIVLGGCAAVDAAAERTGRMRLNRRIQTALPAALNAAFPDLPPLQVACRWAGIMDYTKDAQPLVGVAPSVPTAWVVAGFGGHGLPPAMGVGRAVAGAIVSGEAPRLPDRFDPRRFARVGRPAQAAREAS